MLAAATTPAGHRCAATALAVRGGAAVETRAISIAVDEHLPYEATEHTACEPRQRQRCAANATAIGSESDATLPI